MPLAIAAVAAAWLAYSVKGTVEAVTDDPDVSPGARLAIPSLALGMAAAFGIAWLVRK